MYSRIYGRPMTNEDDKLILISYFQTTKLSELKTKRMATGIHSGYSITLHKNSESKTGQPTNFFKDLLIFF